MQYKYMITKEKCKMTGPKAPKDPTRKRQGFYIMRNKEISGSVQPDGSGVQFIYLNDGRMISSAKIVGNIADDAMLDLLSTAEGFRKLVHSIGVSVEMDSADKKTVFELQMYGKSDMYGSGTTLRMAVVADGMESVLNLSDCVWSDDDDIPGRFALSSTSRSRTAAQRRRWQRSNSI